MNVTSWLPQAQALERGQRRRVSHECSDDRSMIVSAGDTGWNAYCFRCGHGFVPYPQESLSEKLARLAAIATGDSYAAQSVTLPQPIERDVTQWPANCRVWLYKAGFSNEDIARLGWYYNSKTDRVVLPIVDNGEVVFWQARYCGPDKGRPKYLAPSVDRATIVAKYGTGSVLVLTEDIMSAAKVGKVTEAWSLLGTKLLPRILDQVIRQPLPVAVWLDGDTAGIRGAATIINTLRSVGKECYRIQSEKDPKCYNRYEVSDYVFNR